MKYNFLKIEKKWQKLWQEKKVFKASEKSKKSFNGAQDKPKYYQLETFPYPSAAGLHVGHPKGYIAEDIHARYMRMNGKNVLYTMGWDAFGLPTENYAIKVGKSPKEVAAANIKNFKRQVQMFGLSYDWDREINTSSPEYYKWTQWLFLQLYKKGLAYRKKAKVNWCPSCKTVLANEQVIVKSKIKNQKSKPQIKNGKTLDTEAYDVQVCERCETPVEQREMEQWFFKITDYAERLIGGLNGLNWPEATIKRQLDWIGKSEGAIIKFKATSDKRQGNQNSFMSHIANSPVADIEVFTTRPDTLFGATYLVLAPEHPLLGTSDKGQATRIENWPEVKKYIEEATHKTELMRQEQTREKTGVELKGIKAINPATKEEIPIWVADYVLGSYGTGAIMAVPAHDERDFEFAEKFNLPMKQVIAPYFLDTESKDAVRKDKPTVKRRTVYVLVKHYREDKYLCLDWENFGWHSGIIGGVENGEDLVEAAKREIREETGYKDLKFIKFLGGEMHNHYYASHKNENRYAIGHGLLFELSNDDRDEVKAEHTKNHKHIWIEGRKMNEWLNLPAFRYMWQALITGKDCFTGEGVLTSSLQFDGLVSEKAKWEITKFVGGKRKVQYKLRDWSVSRQRYWGVPIPIIYCHKCLEISNLKSQISNKSQIRNSKLQTTTIDGKEYAIHPVPEKDLPVELPDLKDYRPKGVPPLASSEKFLRVKCPMCNGEAKRDPETLDTFVDSSWYYLRYADPHNNKKPFDKLRVNYWCPIDLYVIGAEHTVLHLLYSRFITKFLHDEGYLKFDEPFLRLGHVGLIRGTDGQKMSKSKGNVVNPDEIVGEFGADSVRLYEMFMGPFEDGQPWDPKGVVGAERFLKRFYDYVQKVISSSGKTSDSQRTAIHKAIKKVGGDIENFKFNTAISALMILLNELESALIGKKDAELVIKIINPFAPHLANELWVQLGKKTLLDEEEWPAFDSKLLESETVELIVQVNGKFRGRVAVSKGIPQKDAEKAASQNPDVAKWLTGKEIKRVFFVPDRLINFCLK